MSLNLSLSGMIKIPDAKNKYKVVEFGLMQTPTNASLAIIGKSNPSDPNGEIYKRYEDWVIETFVNTKPDKSDWRNASWNKNYSDELSNDSWIEEHLVSLSDFISSCTSVKWEIG